MFVARFVKCNVMSGDEEGAWNRGWKAEMDEIVMFG